MPDTQRELTTTSYAILGLLTVRPWSTYELAIQMRRNLHYFWPRAESNVYAEPKQLVTGGFARAKAELVGKRRRTVYSITPKGRQALQRWLGVPAAMPRLESEPLVKLAFANQGSKADLVDTLQQFRMGVQARQAELRVIFAEYRRGEDPYPRRAHINIVAYRLLWEQAKAEAAWADWAIDEVASWSDVVSPENREKLVALLEAPISER